MQQIKIKQNGIDTELSSKNFSVIDGDNIYISAGLINDIVYFKQYYNRLEVDRYVMEKENVEYRKRRYGSFTLFTDQCSLSPNPHKTFFQDKNINNLYGGVERNFAPIDDEILHNSFLQELIKADFTTLPISDREKSNQWFVGVQLFRIEATNDYIGHPTPEGIHQDGHYFVLQHLINKKNANGGKSTIYDLNKQEIASLTFEKFLDSCFVKDEFVMHGVSPISCANPDETAIRDMLILDFELIV